MIERANEIRREKNMEKIHLENDVFLSEEYFNHEMSKYSTKEREQMKLCSLDNYTIFIASR